MSDPSEPLRRQRISQINKGPSERDELAVQYGEVYDTSEVQKAFSIEAFMAPYVGCTRKSDGVKGTLEFRHSPRFYFNFKEE